MNLSAVPGFDGAVYLNGFPASKSKKVFPRLAKELKLKEGWDYKELYLSILEDLAKQYRISRFKIYTVEELLRLIHKKAGAAALKAMIPILDSSTQV